MNGLTEPIPVAEESQEPIRSAPRGCSMRLCCLGLSAIALALLGWLAVVDYRSSTKLAGATRSVQVVSLPTTGVYISAPFAEEPVTIDINIESSSAQLQTGRTVVHDGQMITDQEFGGTVLLTLSRYASTMAKAEDSQRTPSGVELPYWRGTYEMEMSTEGSSLLWIVVGPGRRVRILEVFPARHALFGRQRGWRRLAPLCGVTVVNETAPPQTLSSVRVRFGEPRYSFVTDALPPQGFWYVENPAEDTGLEDVRVRYRYPGGPQGHIERSDTDCHMTIRLPARSP